MALVRARFRPSTVISAVVPRAMPCGVTEFSVGGVVRLPVGCNSAPAAAVATSATHRLLRSHRFRMIHLVHLQLPIEETSRQNLSAWCERQPEGPIGLVPHGEDFAEVRGPEYFGGAVGPG